MPDLGTGADFIGRVDIRALMHEHSVMLVSHYDAGTLRGPFSGYL
jgi:hypothetical protein